MDLLDRLLGHDAWTTRQLLRLCEPLTDGELDREFDIGHRSVRATLAHLIWNMEVWSGLMAGAFQLPDARKIAEGRSIPELTARLDRAAADLSRMARSVSQRNGWDEEWLDVLDDPPTRKTYGGAIAHVITHSMHHRAQLLFLLRQLGIRDLPEGDVLSWEQQARPLP
jgi:uncharacterized damage-inducible protein DinB